MRLSKKTEYALRALIYAARHPEGTTFQIKELADRNGIPKKFLELILLELKNTGIVASRRGAGGGYLLARRPESIRSSEVIEAIEGPMSAPAGPGGRGRKPHVEDVSPAFARLRREAGEAIRAVFDRWTIADLAREEQEAAERRRRNLMYHI